MPAVVFSPFYRTTWSNSAEDFTGSLFLDPIHLPRFVQIKRENVFQPHCSIGLRILADTNGVVFFYRAMHSLRGIGIATVSRPSVCPSVCDVDVPWPMAM